jgi:hypothetical protein
MDNTQIGLEIFKGVSTLVASVAALVVSRNIGKGQLSIATQQARTAVESKRIAAAK